MAEEEVDKYLNLDMGPLEIGCDPPCIAVISVDGALIDRLSIGLSQRGWHVVSEVDLGQADVLIFDGHRKLPVGADALLTYVALAFATDACFLIDEVLSTSSGDDDLLQCIDRWRPTPEIANLADVSAVFGDARLRPIVQGFCTLLHTAITDLDADIFVHAHRLAGLAGTLGFKRVSAAWIDIEGARAADVASARREARLACVAARRWLDAT